MQGNLVTEGFQESPMSRTMVVRDPVCCRYLSSSVHGDNIEGGGVDVVTWEVKLDTAFQNTSPKAGKAGHYPEAGEAWLGLPPFLPVPVAEAD
jgi:hypothetical protein